MFFGDIWALRDPIFSATKKSNRERLDRGTSNTCAKFQGLNLKTAWTFGLSCGEVQKSRLGIVITWF